MRLLYKRRINITSDKYIDFLSRDCRINLHKSCHGKWCGLGFKVNCFCTCHNKKSGWPQFPNKSQPNQYADDNNPN